ncbi:response regulator [Virgisporangium aliadipatigenens]|uniref:Response regulator n=1 Tax=Virgisporangium aliadipatigenens TaxID=741659 RepID=A0A8J4DU99_9ACTN|nr:response regulator [Virgisporangium aliadipatigenens]GIJ49843.1 response regulator [Virgisporangium aliadipatigenens]
MLALIVDDSQSMRRVLRRVLAPLGFDAYEAGNGKEALDLLSKVSKRPDLALVDWNMPEMNGLDFIRHVRRMPEFRPMWLMMCTTESEHSQVVRALAAGAHEYVIKPFTSETIHQKLAYLGLISLTSRV